MPNKLKNRIFEAEQAQKLIFEAEQADKSYFLGGIISIIRIIIISSSSIIIISIISDLLTEFCDFSYFSGGLRLGTIGKCGRKLDF